MRATAHGPDLPLSFSSENRSSSNLQQKLTSGPAKIQENTMSLISNVGQGFLNSGERRNSTATGTNVPSNLTPRVIYKLLWHLLKSHRFRMGAFTQSALVGMVFENKDPFLSHNFLMKYLVISNSSSPYATKVDFEWTKAAMRKNLVGDDVKIRDTLSINTILRALRFLPTEYSGRWLTLLIDLSKANHGAASTLVSCADWQPCLFQFISEIIENVATAMPSGTSKTEETHFEGEKYASQSLISKSSSTAFDLSLELYSILLGHIVRNYGDKVREADDIFFLFLYRLLTLLLRS